MNMATWRNLLCDKLVSLGDVLHILLMQLGNSGMKIPLPLNVGAGFTYAEIRVSTVIEGKKEGRGCAVTSEAATWGLDHRNLCVGASEQPRVLRRKRRISSKTSSACSILFNLLR